MTKKVNTIEADESLGEAIKQFADLKAKKDDLNKAIKELNPQIDTLKGIIIARMQGEGAEKVTTELGSCSISTKEYATIKDMAAFLNYICTHGAYELIQKKANDAPCRLIWDEEEGDGEVPGIEKYEDTKLNFRKK